MYVLVKMNSNAIVISKCLADILYHSVVNYFLHIKLSTCQVSLDAYICIFSKTQISENKWVLASESFKKKEVIFESWNQQTTLMLYLAV